MEVDARCRQVDHDHAGLRIALEMRRMLELVVAMPEERPKGVSLATASASS